MIQGNITAISSNGIKLDNELWYNIKIPSHININDYKKGDYVEIEYTELFNRKYIEQINKINNQKENTSISKEQKIIRMNALDRATELHNKYMNEINLDVLKEIAEQLEQWINRE